MNNLWKKGYYLLASLLVLSVTFAIYASIDSILFAQPIEIVQNVYLPKSVPIPFLSSRLDLTDNESLLGQLPATVSAESQFLNNLTSKSIYIEDVDSGTILYEKNSERILLPASTTKLMTALVALDVFQPDQIVTVPSLTTIEGTKPIFPEGMQITVENLLKAALIQSSNEAAYILALNYSEGERAYVDLMNKKAKELRLVSTHFDNPAGFDTDAHRSSARDLAILSKQAMKNSLIAQIVGTKSTIVTDISGEHTFVLENTHQLLGVDPTVVGVKTGTTQGANQVLITQYVREGHSIIIIVMGSDERYIETSALIEWVFDSFVWLSPTDMRNQT